MKRAGHSAGDDAAQGTHRAISRQRRMHRIARFILHRPAKVKVRGIEIQPDADEHPRALEPSPLAHQLRLRHRISCRLKHQQLLRQHVAQLRRRNRKAPDGHRHFINEISLEISRFRMTPPMARLLRLMMILIENRPPCKGIQ